MGARSIDGSSSQTSSRALELAGAAAAVGAMSGGANTIGSSGTAAAGGEGSGAKTIGSSGAVKEAKPSGAKTMGSSGTARVGAAAGGGSSCGAKTIGSSGTAGGAASALAALARAGFFPRAPRFLLRPISGSGARAHLCGIAHTRCGADAHSAEAVASPTRMSGLTAILAHQDADGRRHVAPAVIAATWRGGLSRRRIPNTSSPR